MAEAARSVRHYVSDCLEERHPYDAQKGFAGCRARDAGKVFDGLLPSGIDNLLNSLTDPSVGDEERAKAVHHLYAHSASQEMKIDLLRKGTVSIVVTVLSNTKLNLLEHQCFLLLRSLCVIPQGCYPVVECGGLEAAVRSISLNKDNLENRHEARTAAIHVILQVASNFAGLRWMLAMEDCSEFILQGVDFPLSEIIVTKEDLLGCITDVLKTEAVESRIALYAMSILAQITAVSHGIRAFTKDRAIMDVVTGMVTVFATQEKWGEEVIPFVTQLLTTVWNVSTDQEGVEMMGERDTHGAVLQMFGKISSGAPLGVQRVWSGALSVLYKLDAVKLASSKSVGEQPTLVHVLILYLRDVDELVDAAKKQGKDPSLDIIAISKNIVQCIRIASEMRDVRVITHKYLDHLQEEDPTGAFYFRRQLYYGTAWEEEYDASA